MTTWIEPPPQRQGMGCLAKGCLILLAFVALLSVAFVGGGIFAFRKVKNEFLPTAPLEMPTEEAVAGDVPFNPGVGTVEEQAGGVRERWKAFEEAADAGEAARIELSAGELNNLLASYPHLRGRFHVGISGNTGTLRVSYPLSEIPLMSSMFGGRYLNVEGSVVAAADKAPGEARIDSFTVNGKSMPLDMLDMQFQSYSINGWKREFAKEHNITLFDIADGKMIMEANGGR